MLISIFYLINCQIPELEQAEKRINILVKNENGELEEENFEQE